ncbi:ABC transporter substrate-binding protein [Desulfothermus sp.]
MKKIFTFILMSCLVFSVSSFAGKKIYINGIDANFPPFSYVDKNGNPTGFDVEALNWIAKKMGFKVIHKPMDWDGIIPNLLAKKIDMIAAGMSITPERQKVVNFTIPYWEIKQVIVVRKDSNLTVDDVLKGKKILGVQRGTSEAEWLEKNKSKKGWNFTLRYYDSAPLAVVDLVNGRIDAAAMDDAPAYDAAKKRPVKVLGTFGMPSEKFGYAVRKQDKELLNTLNTGLRMLMKDPYWQELIKKYKPGQ